MDLTRTERLILETAADLFDFEIGAARAATMTKLELTSAELEAADGGRPQLGDLLVSRGWLSPDQLEQVLDRVYGEVQGWSERLVAPTPKPIPRPTETRDQDAQLAELVQQLTGLLDVLVVGGSGDSTIVRRAAAAFSAADAPGPERVRPAPGNTRVEVEDEDEDTKDIPALSSQPSARPAVDEDAPTLNMERKAPVAADDDDEDAPTLHIERAAATQSRDSDLDEDDTRTLHVQRPETKDDDTAHLERKAISPHRSGVEFSWSPPKDDDTAHFERPEGETLHVERSVITTGDTVIIEGTSSGNPS